MEQSYDVAVIGAGPNGLTAAAYLARAGARVVVLEQRFERAGTLASDDYSTPFVYNQAQYLLPLGSALPPFADLSLEAHGVKFIEPQAAFSIVVDESPLVIERGGAGLGTEVETMFADATRAVAPMLYLPAAQAERSHASANGSTSAVSRLAAMSPNDIARLVDDERAAIVLRYASAMVGFARADEAIGVIGAFCLAQAFSPVLATGGSKSLANGLFRAAAAAGARCLVSARVARIIPEQNGVALKLADGRTIHATSAVSTLDPVSTFFELLEPEHRPPELEGLDSRWKLDPTAMFTGHYGIKGDIGSARANRAEEAVVRVLGFSSVNALDEHLTAVSRGELPPNPAGHLTVTSRHDPLQASPGPYGPLHSMRYDTPAPYVHPTGEWDVWRVQYRKECWEFIAANAVDLSSAKVLFAFADSPQDLHRRFRTTRNGSVRQGALRPEQTFTGRPHPSCSESRTPIPGFYLGGGGVHPGVPGSLAGGYLAAGAICDDLGFERWWPAARDPSARKAADV